MKKQVLISGLNTSEQNTGVQYYPEYLFREISTIHSDSLQISIINREKLVFKNSFFRVLYENTLLNRFIQNKKITLYHATSYVIPFFFKPPKSIVTVHDLITIDFPELCKRTSVIYFKLLFRRSLKKAKKIITVSETVKKDIIKHFNIIPSKIKVIPLGVDIVFQRNINKDVKKKYSLPDKYILFVGNLEAKKNLHRLVEAFRILKESTSFDHQLVLVGKKGWGVGNLQKSVGQLGLQKEVVFLGYAPKEDLPTIYSMADLFVFPSIYEGFGIPPLEAMACGTPVLVSKQGASPEICGDACFQVDPYSVEDILRGIKELLFNEDLRLELIEKGKTHINQYSWKRTAIETLKIYEEVCD